MKKKKMNFNFESIWKSNEPFLILEIGVNYYDIAEKEDMIPLDAAKLMIDKAKQYGGKCVKFQSYKADKLASENSPSYWDLAKEPTKSQFELFKKFDKFDEAEYRELAQYCESKDVVFSSTPFDFEAVDYLDDLMPFYKISSSDITNIPFIQYIARKNKPIFLSTGGATLEEINEAVKAIEKQGNQHIGILHCVLCYPTDYKDIHLNMIQCLRKSFPKYLIGFSDHTIPDPSMLVLTIAYLLGAQIIEKHFTLDKGLPGNDHYHALDCQDLMKFNNNIHLLNKIRGTYKKQPLPCEMTSIKNARRSIITKHNLKKGHVLTKTDITFKRPGTGISPKDLGLIIGKQLRKDIKADEILTWNHIQA